MLKMQRLSFKTPTLSTLSQTTRLSSRTLVPSSQRLHQKATTLRQNHTSKPANPPRSTMAPDISNIDPITTAESHDHTLPDDQPIPESSQTSAQGPSAALFSLSNSTILLTGGGRGVGLVQAIACAEAGAHVACVDLLPQPAEPQWSELLAAAKKAGTSATYYRGDITSEESMGEIFDEVAEGAKARGGELRGVVACAGIQQMTPVLEYKAEDFDRMMRVNAMGTFVTAKLGAKRMVKDGVKGSIVLIASISGRIANRVSRNRPSLPFFASPTWWQSVAYRFTNIACLQGLTCSAYNTSKGAVLQLCRSMAQEIGVHGIRINCISPGVSSPH